MAAGKIVITLDERTLKGVDRLVRERCYPNRSYVVQAALDEMLRHSSRLAEEAIKLDANEERDLAEEGLRIEERLEY